MAKDNGKVVAILSYITIIGWIIAFIMHNNNKTPLGGYHVRQALLLHISAIVVGFVPIIGWVLGIVIFVFAIMGLVYAIQEQQKPVPVLGDLAQQWFKGL